MSLWFVAHYDLMRGLHILAVIAWMAGLLYLPRLYVYHCGAIAGGELDTTLKIMERRLLRGIINPSMIITLIFGLCLSVADGNIRGWGFLLQPWMITKLVGAAFLFAWHGYLARARKHFEDGINIRPEKFWRATNELPFLAAIIMVIAVTTEFGRH